MNDTRPTLHLTVTGMTCGHCEQAVKQAVQQLDRQAQISIDRAASSVQVQTTASAEAVCAAIANEGYAAAPKA